MNPALLFTIFCMIAGIVFASVDNYNHRLDHNHYDGTQRIAPPDLCVKDKWGNMIDDTATQLWIRQCEIDGKGW